MQSILCTARPGNPEQGITGLLVFGSGSFSQWLEGPRDNIGAPMARQQADTRHEAIVTLGEFEALRERLFADRDRERVIGADIRDVLPGALNSARDASSADTLRDLLLRLQSGDLGRLGAG